MPKPADIWMDFALDDLDGGEMLFAGNEMSGIRRKRTGKVDFNDCVALMSY